MTKPPCKVLLLFFQETDLKFLTEERRLLTESFKSINCPVSNLQINKWDGTWRRKIKEFLSQDQTPRIIYYGGHGSSSNDDMELTFVGLTKDQTAYWANLKDLVTDATCPVLIILDCCDAGTALSDLAPDKPSAYPKDIIVATHWDGAVTDKPVPALCKVLRPWATSSSPRSARNLHLAVTSEFHEIRKKVTRSIVMAKTEADRLTWKIKLEKQFINDERAQIRRISETMQRNENEEAPTDKELGMFQPVVERRVYEVGLA